LRITINIIPVVNFSRPEVLLWSLLLTVALIAATVATGEHSKSNHFDNRKGESAVLVLGLSRSGSLAMHNFVLAMMSGRLTGFTGDFTRK
jgi:hypothetical protein